MSRQAGGASFRNHHALRARGQRRAHDRAQIMRILDAIEQDQQALRGFRAQQILELDGGLGGGERGDALMLARAGEAVDLLPLFEAHRNAARFREPHHRSPRGRHAVRARSRCGRAAALPPAPLRPREIQSSSS